MAIELFYLFVLSSLISFVGSLQPGPVNLSVIHASYSQNFKTALLVAIGGALPELIYSAAALCCSYVFIAHPALSKLLHSLNALILVAAGITILFQRNTKPEQKPQPKIANSVFAGFLMGFFNPMLFTFWLLISNSLQHTHLIRLNAIQERIAFITGTFAGALLLLVIIAFAGARKKKSFFDRYSSVVNKLIGIILLLLAARELYQLYLE